MSRNGRHGRIHRSRGDRLHRALRGLNSHVDGSSGSRGAVFRGIRDDNVNMLPPASSYNAWQFRLHRRIETLTMTSHYSGPIRASSLRYFGDFSQWSGRPHSSMCPPLVVTRARAAVGKTRSRCCVAHGFLAAWRVNVQRTPASGVAYTVVTPRRSPTPQHAGTLMRRPATSTQPEPSERSAAVQRGSTRVFPRALAQWEHWGVGSTVLRRGGWIFRFSMI